MFFDICLRDTVLLELARMNSRQMLAGTFAIVGLSAPIHFVSGV